MAIVLSVVLMILILAVAVNCADNAKRNQYSSPSKTVSLKRHPARARNRADTSAGSRNSLREKNLAMNNLTDELRKLLEEIEITENIVTVEEEIKKAREKLKILESKCEYRIDPGIIEKPRSA